MKNHKVYKSLLLLILAVFMYESGYGQKVITSHNKIVYRHDDNDNESTLTIDVANGTVGVNVPDPKFPLEVAGKVVIRESGQTVNIGQDYNYNLWVTNGVVAEDLFIVDADNWADYVFEEDHDLPSLEEIQLYIDQHKHLPGVPSAAEVKEAGYAQHELNTIFLEKIEELTLYTIEQHKLIETQSKTIKKQIKEIDRLMEQVSESKKNIDK